MRKKGVPNKIKKPAIKRFLSKIIFNKITNCWEWLSLKYFREYPKIKVNGVAIRASRFSYETYIGELPKGLLICHKCDNPRCVSPFHIFAGTHFDNMKDAREKGRKPKGDHPSQKTLKEGCRCEECLKLQSDIGKARWEAYKLKNNIKSKTPSIHGTASYYSNKKCRCELCVEAHRKESAEYRVRKKNIK